MLRLSWEPLILISKKHIVILNILYFLFSSLIFLIIKDISFLGILLLIFIFSLELNLYISLNNIKLILIYKELFVTILISYLVGLKGCQVGIVVEVTELGVFK